MGQWVPPTYMSTVKNTNMQTHEYNIHSEQNLEDCVWNNGWNFMIPDIGIFANLPKFQGIEKHVDNTFL